jgi:glutamyl-Q tRNA(Asp) synthetase
VLAAMNRHFSYSPVAARPVSTNGRLRAAVSAAPVAPPPAYRGRFAPSPTGPLHFGSLVAALASYCDARAAAAPWLLRIEDVDEPRSRPARRSPSSYALERYGFEWDGPVVRQSERGALYEDGAGATARKRPVYACACTRRELETARVGVAGERVYPGPAATASAPVGCAPDCARGACASTRQIVAFTDRLQHRSGRTSHATSATSSSARRRTVRVPARRRRRRRAQGVTAVVRGADLLASTPRQIHLQHLLGLPTPAYLHVPVAINRGGREAVEADARASAAKTIPCRRCSPPGASSTSAARDAAGDSGGVPGLRRSRVVARAPAAGADAAGAARILASRRHPRDEPCRPGMRAYNRGFCSHPTLVAAFSPRCAGSLPFHDHTRCRPQGRRNRHRRRFADHLWRHPSGRRNTTAPTTRSCTTAATYIGLCGSAAHQLVFESLLRRHDDLDFSNKFAIFETFRKLHPILKEQHFLNPKEEEDDPYESTQITALIANPSTGSSACIRCARCSSTRSSGPRARAASSRSARCTRCSRVSSPRRPSRGPEWMPVRCSTRIPRCR